MKKAVIVLAVILVLILIGGVGYIVWDNAQSNIGQAENNKPNETIVNDTAKAAELREKLKEKFDLANKLARDIEYQELDLLDS